MSRRATWRRALAEFTVVVFGVLAALAADGLREDLGDRAVERDYLRRLELELTNGQARVATIAARFVLVDAASEQLVQVLESGGAVPDTSRFLDLAARAGQYGFNRNEANHRATYDELIATGNFALVRDADVRTAVVDHFRKADLLLGGLENMPGAYNVRFKSITGVSPANYLAGTVPLSNAARSRVLRELREDEEVLRELRFFIAQLPARMQEFAELEESFNDVLLAIRAARGSV